MVVGTTGWYGELEKVRQLVEKSGTGFLYAANFSIGINLLFEVAQHRRRLRCSISIRDKSSSVITPRKKTRLRERQ